jgi:soluble lytic murein transglycosylase-like protein
MTYDVVQVAGAAIPRSTLKGIQVASAQSGVSFQYLLAKAAQESGFKADAEAATSSATGLYQFTRGTWLDVFKRHGEELGYGELSNRIITGPSGRLTVFDKTVEQKILSLREDPAASAKFAAAYARDNAAALGQNLSRELDATDLYLAHFLGPSGANQLLNAAPNIYASHVVPDAARANRGVFFNETGAPRTVRQVLDLIRSRFDNQMDRFADVAATMAGEDDAQAMSAAQETSAPRIVAGSPNLLDFGSALQSGDSERTALSWFVMQELARMISSQPMSMLGEEESADTDSTTRLSSSGFQGEDLSQVLVDSMARNTMSPSMSSAITSGQASRAYGALNKR